MERISRLRKPEEAAASAIRKGINGPNFSGLQRGLAYRNVAN
jgi:hypothetical protein